MTELGNTLRAAREANGLSLDDLQQLTKIQKRYLIGIEKGNYDMMPGKFYVRAFIKQYAEAVGLDPEEIFEQYKNEVPAAREEESTEQLSRVQSKKTISPSQSKLLEALPKILVGVFIIGAAVLVWFLVSNVVGSKNNNSPKDSDQPIVIEQNEDAKTDNKDKENATVNKDKDKNKADKEDKKDKKEPAKKQEIAAVQASGKHSTYELKNAETFKLKLSAKGDTWVNIKDGTGKSVFQGLLKENESKEVDLTDQSKTDLVIGNSINTDIYVNDELLPYQNNPNEIVRQDITITFTKAE
ncbi:helix-turn-helix domain-containing protein [Bacillus massiliigorillae]|uniref:helix-turn-helix domain-containing protein n=1 Tax=Bacillus massiliigorillae TaxID=1243664 RepID=UPI00039BA399|nr:RodZ domain-containing protein [Bacillus massiliigorillae]